DIEQSVDGFSGLWQRIAETAPAPVEDAVRSALMLFPLGESREDTLQRALSFSRNVRDTSFTSVADTATSILITQSLHSDYPATISRYREFYEGLRSQTLTESEIGLASALLTVEGGPDGPMALRRFAVARQYLERFNGNGMLVPAAMLAILSTEIEESLDNLRIASSGIS